MVSSRTLRWIIAVLAAIILVVGGAAIVVDAAQAATPALSPPFDSDLEEDGDVAVCNPENLIVGRVAQMVIDWNDQTQVLPGADPRFVLVGPGEFCELRIDAQGGLSASYYAQIDFPVHPDNLDYSKAFGNLTSNQKRGTLNHEGGHTFGLAHPPVSPYWCKNSVESTLNGCKSAGVARRITPGPEDLAALDANWSPDGQNPVHNKCWTTACDNFGPPQADNQGTPEAIVIEGQAQ